MPSYLPQDALNTWKSLFLAILLVLVIYLKLSRSRKGPLPPGPPGLPIVGNALQLARRPWAKFANWAKEYGPIIYLNIAGQDAIVLNSHKVAADLLDRRAGIYSDRPHNVVATELLTGGMVFAFAQHNDIWKRQRRGAHEALNNQVAPKYHRFQEIEALLLAETLLQDPEDWDNHLRRASTSLAMSIIYGLPPITDSKDPVILRANHFTERALEASLPGAYLVDTVYFSWLRYLPRWMSPWRRYAEECFKKDAVLFEGIFNDIRERIKAGDETPSVVSDLIHDPKKSLSDSEAAWLAVTLYTAASETTASQLTWLLIAMILHPEVQKRAQDDIDRVVGRHRLPTFQDQESLPYITAIVKELMRWRGVGPLGVPHRLCQDDVYEGHFIPKDTLCIVNVWHLNKDPNVYGADAEEFKPERHLDVNGNLKPSIPDTKDESHVTYGFGRRICVGRHVSNNSLFIEIATLLWAFSITAGKDNVLPNPDEIVDEGLGLLMRPKPFPCAITPRSQDVHSMILHTKELYEVPENASPSYGQYL